ncbi:hypothetical protein U5A82_21400 [Sphingobium sp. CR2-8]|uniref:hypothetical protein n=1 Tax=Sphingobium sp. CR2-8 TaxID=1306534 RepID=UPI002DB7CC92|nr:hypothetical protein [Sphingobium sp. CR2-8]MEC3912933.1 hypothetical protein [Sphingobium sp. CR2-8]
MLRKLCSLLLVMIASSLVLTATVHAREVSGQLMVDCAGVVHEDGDADQSQGDSDKAVPHHHSTCHGPTLNIADVSDLYSVGPASGLHPFPVPQSALASYRAGPALRPPAL